MGADPRPVLVLASASPRRRALLAEVGIVADVQPVDVDESMLVGEDARTYVERVATLKRDTALERDGARAAAVLAADTIVVVDGDVLGKPVDDADATAMVTRLLGRSHTVMTAVALQYGAHGRVFVESTRVHMRAADADAIARYVATGEGRDKAGSYGVQGIAGGFVTGIEGSYSNVVGLPVAQTVSALLEVGVLDGWPRRAGSASER